MLIHSLVKNYVKGKSFKNKTEKYQSSKGLADTECHGIMSDQKLIKDTIYIYKACFFYIYILLHIERYG